MAVTLTNAARSAMCDALVDLIDIGAGTNGTIIIATGADVEVATLTFSTTAFGAASNGVATAASITSDTSATGNASAVDKFIVRDQDNTEVFRGSVGATSSGEDMELSSTTIGAGDTVSLSSFTVTVPAS